MTEGVLAVLGDGWRKITIFDNGDRACDAGAGHHRCQCQQGAQALQPQARVRIRQARPPARSAAWSTTTRRACAVALPTTPTTPCARLRVMLTDGTVLDSGDADSVASLPPVATPSILDATASALHHEVMANAELVALIRKKYRIKNTVGYSINALIDFHDPIDILIHLIVGSEGTLGFVSEVTYRDHSRAPVQGDGARCPFPDPLFVRPRHLKTGQWRRAARRTGVTAAEYIERRALADGRAPAGDGSPMCSSSPSTSPVILIDVTAPEPGGRWRPRGRRRPSSHPPLGEGGNSISSSRPTGMARGRHRALGCAQGVLRRSGGASAAQGHLDAHRRRCRRRSTGWPTSSSICANCSTHCGYDDAIIVRPRACRKPPFPDERRTSCKPDAADRSSIISRRRSDGAGLGPAMAAR